MELDSSKPKDIWAEPDDKLMKNLEAMRKFSVRYAQNTNTKFCIDPEVTATVIKGLAKNRVELGAPLCPCRHYDDPLAEIKKGFWNCPCEPMRLEGECHCMLFLQPDNDFADSEDPAITTEFILDTK